MNSMFLYYLLIVDFVVFSYRVSAFVRFCCWMLGVLGLRIFLLTFAVVTTAASVSVCMGSQSSSTMD